MTPRMTADTIGPLNKKNIEAQFCSDWLKDEILRVFAELDATRADLATAVEAMILTRSRADDYSDSYISKPAREALAKLSKALGCEK